MRIELLYFDGCPNHEAFLPALRELLNALGVSDEIRLLRVESHEAAERERFLGSPTVRIDGQDVDPGADERTDYGFKCRLYRTSEGLAGVPADDWVLDAIRAAAGSDSTVAQGVEGHVRAGLGPVEVRSWASRRLVGLADVERQLHRRIVRSMAGGHVVEACDLAHWAAEEQLDLESAMRQIERHDLALRNPETGAVVVAYPFSAHATAHRVSIAGGVDVFAMCAIDALGVAFMIGQPVEVRSTDPATGAEVQVAVAPGGATGWQPRDAVVVLGCAGSGPSADRMCPHTNFAESRRSAEAQLDTIGGSGSILSMSAAIETGRSIFGCLLVDDQWRADAAAS